MNTGKEKRHAMEEAVIKLRDRNTAYRAYNENDVFTLNGSPAFGVLDYWRFMFSQLNNQQETIAEYLVNRSLGVDKAENVSYWTGYDLSYRAKRIEVKASILRSSSRFSRNCLIWLKVRLNWNTA